MNRSKLLVASMGGAMILSFAQFALASDASANTKGAPDTQYQVAMAKCEAGASTNRTACTTAVKSARDTSKPASVARDDGIPTDSQDRLQFDP
jgi:hypothetical protein